MSIDPTSARPLEVDPSRPDGIRANVRLAALATIGALGPRLGITRLGFSEEEQAAIEMVAEWMRQAGLVLSWDAAGNLLARLVGSEPELPELWTGSHLDSVPGGGRFDGPLGVVTALEAVELLRRNGLRPRRTITVVVLRDEEGSRFGTGLFGSRAIVGDVDDDELGLFDTSGMSLRQALASRGFGPIEPGRWLHRAPYAFVEVHIEQGTRLQECGRPLAVVTEVAGAVLLELDFEGSVGHVGTTPMERRSDALCAAADLVLAVQEWSRGSDDSVATASTLTVKPNAMNIIAGRTQVHVDVRITKPDQIEAVRSAVDLMASQAAQKNACRHVTRVLWQGDPVGMDEGISAVLAEAVGPEGQRVALPSWAIHDAAMLGRAGIPVGMMFVRSLAGGISHAPEEDCADGDVDTGVMALAKALAVMADAG